MFKYEISGYYYADDKRVHFDKVIEAKDNVSAMAEAIGYCAWDCTCQGKVFKLDTIHYECL